MKYKTIIILRKIFAPFIIIFFSGFVGCYNFKKFTKEIHNKAIEEKRTNVWFAKKAIRLYFSIFFFTFLNIFSWIGLIYFIFR